MAISHDPYRALEVSPDADDAAIRAAYLAKVQAFPPEQFPQEFAAIRKAYEAVKDFDSRVRLRVFIQADPDGITAIHNAVANTMPRQRVTLEALLNATFKPQ